MQKYVIIIMLAVILTSGVSGAGERETTIQLATINWEPFTGESLENHGFFSELVTESLKRVGYRVEYRYYPWSRALRLAMNGDVHGIMDAYWKADRTPYLCFPDVVWQVREDFITLQNHPITYDGTMASLKGYTIGVLHQSAQAEELALAGVDIDPVNDQNLNLKKLFRGRIDAMVIPREIFFYKLEYLDSRFKKRRRVRILKPPFKVYDMYVAFSKARSGCRKLTADFNRGLGLIKSDGTFRRILEKHDIEGGP